MPRRMPSAARASGETARLRAARALLCAALIGTSGTAAGAQRLPLRCWGVRDGLAAPRVLAILQDTRGYLWIGTEEGLSRFDGYQLRNFGVDDGLGHPSVNDLVEDPLGEVWVATNGGGLSRIEHASPPRGEPLRSFSVGPGPQDDRVNALLFDDDQIWALSDGGVFAGARAADDPPRFRRAIARDGGPFWMAALRGSDGRLWFGIEGALLEVTGDSTRRHPLPEPLAATAPTRLLERRDGSLLVATYDAGVQVFRPDAPPPLAWQRLPVALEPQQTPFDLAWGESGELWIATRYGLIRWRDGEQQTFGEAHGLPDRHVRRLARDRDGNLWIGTNSAGVCRLASEGIVNYTMAEGLPATAVDRVFETAEGAILAITSFSGTALVRDTGLAALPGSERPPWTTIGERIVRDRAGGWWLGTGAWFEGNTGTLFRLPPGPLPDFGRAVEVSGALGLPDGSGALPGPMQVTDDGALWIVFFGHGLYRRAPGAERFERVVADSHVAAFLPEPDGDLWYSTYTDLRLARNGSTRVVQQPLGSLRANAESMLRDRSGRVWIGFRRLGLGRVVESPGETPRIERFTTTDGLISDAIAALAEDPRGRIWIGTLRGVQVLDPESGRLRRLTMADGLAGDSIEHLHLDRRGRMWVATATGLSRVDLGKEPPVPEPPPVFLTRVDAGGNEQPISPFGLARLERLRLVEPRNDLLVEFVGLGFARERELQYQYRLLGAGDRWSAPADQRSVHFAQLAPGSYRLQVRAINEAGVASKRPAEIALRVLPPVWRRGWFLALFGSTIGAAIFWLLRQRTARRRALERVRVQIAADLHDDIGAGLSEIAILSEAARGASAQERALSDETMARVAERARSLRRALADTVWAVDPRRDRADELLHRMREVTHNLLAARDVAVEFTAPPAERLERIPLAPDQRRDLLFLFEELIHNVARHAAAERVAIELSVDRSALGLSVSDDGRGFDPAAPCAGRGLASMRARAERLGARLQFDAAPGRGCAVRVVAPLRP